jgi:hypothetical protein
MHLIICKPTLMPKSLQLSIPVPCQEKWQAMEPVNGGRYCSRCQQTVVDFSGMSDREVLQFLEQTSGRVCGRLHTDQLNRDIQAPCNTRLPWLKYLLTVSIPAFLASFKGNAPTAKQLPVMEMVSPKEGPRTIEEHLLHSSDSTDLVVMGRVLEPGGLALQGASIMIKGSSRGTTTDAQGYFMLKFLDEKEVPLVISAIGFATREIWVKPAKTTAATMVEVKLTDRQEIVLGELVIVAPRKKKTPEKIVTDTPSTSPLHPPVKIFPNPVSAGHPVTLEMPIKKKGNYVVEVINLGGQLAKSESISAGKGFHTTTIQTQDLVAGEYVVVIRDRAGTKAGVGKLLVR